MSDETANPSADAGSLDELEALLLARLTGMGQAAGVEAPGTVPGETAVMERCRVLTARLAMLEENFARMCLTVGRLEQELAALKGAGEEEGR